MVTKETGSQKPRDGVDVISQPKQTERREGFKDNGFVGQFHRAFRAVIDEKFPNGLSDEQRVAMALALREEDFVAKMTAPLPELVLDAARGAINSAQKTVDNDELQQQVAALEVDNAALTSEVTAQTDKFRVLAERVRTMGTRTEAIGGRAETLFEDMGILSEANGLSAMTAQFKLLQREGLTTDISLITFRSNGADLAKLAKAFVAMSTRDNDNMFLTNDGSSLVIYLSGCKEGNAAEIAKEVVESASVEVSEENASVAVSHFEIDSTNSRYMPDASKNVEIALDPLDGELLVEDGTIFSASFELDENGQFVPSYPEEDEGEFEEANVS